MVCCNEIRSGIEAIADSGLYPFSFVVWMCGRDPFSTESFGA